MCVRVSIGVLCGTTCILWTPSATARSEPLVSGVCVCVCFEHRLFLSRRSKGRRPLHILTRALQPRLISARVCGRELLVQADRRKPPPAGHLPVLLQQSLRVALPQPLARTAPFRSLRIVILYATSQVWRDGTFKQRHNGTNGFTGDTG